MDRPDAHADSQRHDDGSTPSLEFQTANVVTISFAHALNDVYASFLAPLLPALIANFSLSNTQAGLLAFMQSSPSLLQPVIGHLADRASLRYFVILMPALAGTSMALLGVAPRYAAVALLVTFAGLCSAAFHAAAPAMAGRLSGWRLGRGLGLWTVGGYLGFAVGPILVTYVVNAATLRATPWLAIGGWVGSLILYLRLRHVPFQPPASTAPASWRHGIEGMRPILVPAVGITLARAMSFAATLTFLPVLLTSQGVDLWQAGISLSTVQFASAAGALIAGSASDRLGRRPVMLCSIFLASPLIFGLIMLRGWPQAAVLLGLGASVPATHVLLLALMQEVCPDNRALATGVLLSLTFVSESAGAVMLGALADAFGLPIAYAVAGLVFFAAFPLVFLLPGQSEAPSPPIPGEPHRRTTISKR
jgi:FSR family fosmidomycin resistance protein-like MFS transporter